MRSPGTKSNQPKTNLVHQHIHFLNSSPASGFERDILSGDRLRSKPKGKGRKVEEIAMEWIGKMDVSGGRSSC